MDKEMWHTYRMELLSSPKRRGYLAIWDKLNTFILKVTADFWLGQDRGSLIQQPLLCRLQVKFKTRGQRNIHLQLYEVNTNRQMRPGSKAEYQPVRGLWCFFPVSCLLAYPKQVMPNSSLKLKTLGSTLFFSARRVKKCETYITRSEGGHPHQFLFLPGYHISPATSVMTEASKP